MIMIINYDYENNNDYDNYYYVSELILTPPPSSLLEAVCKVKQGVLFLLFFAWCNLIIILAMDRLANIFLLKPHHFSPDTLPYFPP